jgi:hypothetical protein
LRDAAARLRHGADAVDRADVADEAQDLAISAPAPRAQSARTIAPGPDLDRYGAGTEHRRQPVQQAIVAGIAAIARQFDVRLLAEWMKTGAELTVLRAAGNLFQGDYSHGPR